MKSLYSILLLSFLLLLGTSSFSSPDFGSADLERFRQALVSIQSHLEEDESLVALAIKKETQEKDHFLSQAQGAATGRSAEINNLATQIASIDEELHQASLRVREYVTSEDGSVDENVYQDMMKTANAEAARKKELLVNLKLSMEDRARKFWSDIEKHCNAISSQITERVVSSGIGEADEISDLEHQMMRLLSSLKRTQGYLATATPDDPYYAKDKEEESSLIANIRLLGETVKSTIEPSLMTLRRLQENPSLGELRSSFSKAIEGIHAWVKETFDVLEPKE